MHSLLDCRELINYQRYPIDLPDDPRRQAAVQQVRDELADDGCAVIRNFFSGPGLETLVGEAEDRKSQTYYSPAKECNVYLNDGNPDFPSAHPTNIMKPRTNGFITADLFGEDTGDRHGQLLLMLCFRFLHRAGDQ